MQTSSGHQLRGHSGKATQGRAAARRSTPALRCATSCTHRLSHTVRPYLQSLLKLGAVAEVAFVRTDQQGKARRRVALLVEVRAGQTRAEHLYTPELGPKLMALLCLTLCSAGLDPKPFQSRRGLADSEDQTVTGAHQALARRRRRTEPACTQRYARNQRCQLRSPASLRSWQYRQWLKPHVALVRLSCRV